MQKRVKINSIISNQLPEYIQAEYPLFLEFLKQYYISLESPGKSVDLVNNIDQYLKIDNVTNLISSTTLTSNVTLLDTTINVESTDGFSDSFGLLLIDDEVITYEYKTATTFENCYRGFSGVTSYNENKSEDMLTFSETLTQNHVSGTLVNNLNSLLLNAFFKKLKVQFAPGFSGLEFFDQLNENIFVKQLKDFYTSKGTAQSFSILFKALYGVDAQVILPRDYLFETSVAKYRISKQLVLEPIDEVDASQIVNKTLYQDASTLAPYSEGVINDVEEFFVNNFNVQSFYITPVSRLSAFSPIKKYIRISLDFDYNKDINVRGSTKGEFTIHPKTKLTTDVIANQTHLDVDSTVGFPNSGTLIINLPDSSTTTVTYQSKSLNQFFNCEGINQGIVSGEEVKYNDYVYILDSNNNQIKFRSTGVVSEVIIPNDTVLLEKDDTIKLQHLGKVSSDIKFNNWHFNVKANYEVLSVTLLDATSQTYEIETYDETDLNLGDRVYLQSTSGQITSTGKIVTLNNKKVFAISEQGVVDTTKRYKLYKVILKTSFKNYPELNFYNSNVSNVYYDSDENSVYVNAPSLPYYDEELKIYDQKISGTVISNEIVFSSKHPFLSGENVVVKIDNNSSQVIGYVQKVSNTKIKIGESRESIFNDIFKDLSNFENNSVVVEPLSFNNFDFESQKFLSKQIRPQGLIRKFSSPTVYKNSEDGITKSGPIGLFVNGVEIYNYKSPNFIYYGPIESIDVLSKGSGYDVINPPILEIADSVGSGTSAYANVKGGLQRIDILNPGFNYIEQPKIEIVGGNGTNANAEISLISYTHSSNFNANTSSVNSGDNSITFSSPHKFSDGEEVIYVTQNTKNITGLSTNASYFVKTVGISTIKLYSSLENIIGDDEIAISVSSNIGQQAFQSKNKKRKIGSINIVNSGENYETKKYIINSLDVNIHSNTILIQNHGFTTGETVSYSSNGTVIGGLTTSNYYVEAISENSIRLYEIDSLNADFFLKTGQYINFTDSGSGTHIIKYPEISVNIIGKYQIPTGSSSENFSAQIQPIFRGGVENIFVEDGGSEYGVSDIINYERQPSINLNSGSGGQISVVVSNGSIISAFVVNSGNDYNSPPDLLISGDGAGAKLTPIVENGQLVDVVLVAGGSGYSQNTTSVSVIAAGSEAKLYSRISKWNINLVSRYLNNLDIENTLDDGVIFSNITNNSLQYSHLYASRQLRQIVSAQNIPGANPQYISDLILANDVEVDSSLHSPIIGWAYDGNPIYGPYSYENTDGTGSIVQMTSSYVLSLNSNRPLNYPNGYFVDDYVFDGSGHLDEHNGRFCVTPEYPQGTYAYFVTFELNSNSGFNDFKLPKFPYVIGNSYQSTPILFNFDVFSNDQNIDINETNWLRNTNPYNVSRDRSGYDYFVNPNVVNVDSTVVSTKKGKVDSVAILDGGLNYKVNDKITFTNSDPIVEEKAKAVVKSIQGVGINTITCTQTKYLNVEFLKKSNNQYVGIFTDVHDLDNFDILNVSFVNEPVQEVSVNYDQNQYVLVSGISSASTTGISTYISVSGNLNSNNIRTNDYYQLNSEIIKILEIDSVSNRIRILRAQKETSGVSSHSSGSILSELSRKINVRLSPENEYPNKINKEIYFNPVESLGIGTIIGPNYNTTLEFSNPGVGITNLKIPTGQIYLKNHQLETGEELIYRNNGGTSITVSNDGSSSFVLDDESSLYTVKYTNDLIGISTNPIGIGSDGEFVGITSIGANILYLIGIGTNTYHSFSTNYNNILSGEVFKNNVIVSTASSHNLNPLDDVTVNLDLNNITKTVKVVYNQENRRIVFNPLGITTSSIVRDAIKIENHNLILGDKIVYESDNLIGGLSNNGMYYTIPINSNEFRLAETKYDSLNNNFISLTGIGTGKVSKINPLIEIKKYQKLEFDLTDESLSYSNGITRIPGFNLNIFSDQLFSNNFYETNNENLIIENIGEMGVDANAKTIITTNQNSPTILYYKFEPLLADTNPTENKELLIDDEQSNYNKIVIQDSGYNGNHTIIRKGPDSFTYNLLQFPESSSYVSFNGNLNYTTTSNNVSGTISEIVVKNSSKNFKETPSISNISTDEGTNAILFANSSTIGKFNSAKLSSIGYNFSADLSLRPTILPPTLLKINRFSIFDTIKVVDPGFSYNTNVTLIVLDGLTGEIVNDVKLEYDFENQIVDIIENTNGISEYSPILVPINSSNGLEVRSASYDSVLERVTLTLAPTFSDSEDFPFAVGSKFLIEGFIIDETDSNYKTYNSQDFNYRLFEVVDFDANIGGANATITYSVDGLLTGDAEFGTINSFLSNGIVVPQSYFPTFDITLKSQNFIVGELVFSNNVFGVVSSWNNQNGQLKLITNDNFELGSNIIGQNSKSKGTIIEISQIEGTYNIASSSVVEEGWKDEKGFTSNSLQRLHDNDYYQYFSYSVRSEVDFDTWNDPVSFLNHTAGFKKFSDLSVVSDSTNSGISTNQSDGDFSSIADLSSTVDVFCNYNFDLVSENNITINGILSSNKINFNSRLISDYIESIGNRVLSIDDISDQFDSTIFTSNSFSLFDTSLENFRYSKFFVTLEKSQIPIFSQFDIVSVLYDGNQAYFNEYSQIISELDIGTYDVGIGTNIALNFSPSNLTLDTTALNITSFNLSDGLVGIETSSLGDSGFIVSNIVEIPESTSGAYEIASIGSSCRSAKILTVIGSYIESNFQSSEINLIHDDTVVYFNEYGNLNSNVGGLGTFHAYISGSNIIVDFIPNASTASTYFANSVISGITTNAYSGIGTITAGDTEIQTNVVSIATSATPSPVAIGSFPVTSTSTGYYLMSIEDVTNQNYKISEIIAHANLTNNTSYYMEYGIVESSSVVGIITSYLTDNTLLLYFTPDANTEYNIKSIQHEFIPSPDPGSYSLSTSNAIQNSFKLYDSSFNSNSLSFDLEHNGLNIFVRSFDSDDSDIVNISDDTITIPNHFYSTGEELEYIYNSNQPIGIATTTIAGVGSTDILPSTIYVVAIDSKTIRVSGTATEALLATPEYLNITTLGIGTHTFKAKKQNEKSLITIDNVIQTPLVGLSNTTILTSSVGPLDFTLTVENSNTFKSGDYIKINSEIFKVLSSNTNTNTLIVDRQKLGTTSIFHNDGDLVQQINGEYNIVDNTIHFSEPPQGNVPIENENIPDEVDYTGIQTSSTFNGRVFLRSGIQNTSIKPYDTNYIFDPLTESFNGLNNTFNLTADNQNITGISTNNAIILIRNIFQPPQVGSIEGSYINEENLGITSITFTGDVNVASYDINTSGVPRGGIIISAGSSSGFGYQPLVSAAATVTLSDTGTITAISIGNSGSGYRSGIQTVNVSIQTGDLIDTNITQVGVATISDGHVIGIALTNPGIGYTYFETLYTTEIISSVGSASTIFYVDDTFDIDNSYFVQVGTGLTNVAIVGVSDTSFTIDSSDSVLSTFSAGDEVQFKLYNPPKVIFDDPLPYCNIPLLYSADSQSGIGTEATVDIVVSQDTSILEFEINNYGYAYNVGDRLTVAIGGTTGIPTTQSPQFSEFYVDVVDVYYDKFFGWHLGQLVLLDPFDDLIDGKRKLFPLRIANEQTSFEPKEGLNIDIEYNLLIFVDDVLQIPGESYLFSGGSLVEFTEPLAAGSKTSILFYLGTPDVDTQIVDVIETIKIGDRVKITSDNVDLSENQRIVQDIISSDSLKTNIYSGKGIVDEIELRNLIWCQQKNDIFISNVGVGQSTNNFKVFKSRENYSANIYPYAYLIADLSDQDSAIFVDSVKTFFDSYDEYQSQPTNIKTISITSQDSRSPGIATAIVSVAGTISSIDLVSAGTGYTVAPNVAISSPIGVGTTAILTANLSGSSINSIQITNPGTNYSTENPPSILISPPPMVHEVIEQVLYEGDFGIITGIGTTNVGVSTGIVFDFFIPPSSYLRDSEYIQTPISVSGIQTGYYFVIRNSNTGDGITSLDESDQIVGIGSTFIDNVYKVYDYSIVSETVPGIGTTSVVKVIINSSDNSNISTGQTYCYGEFSWGKITNLIRKNPTNFSVYQNGLLGVSTSPVVQRINALKISNYNV